MTEMLLCSFFLTFEMQTVQKSSRKKSGNFYHYSVLQNLSKKRKVRYDCVAHSNNFT